MVLNYTVCEAGSNWHTADTVESSGRFDLFSITVIYKIWAGISISIFEGPFPLLLKSSLGV